MTASGPVAAVTRYVEACNDGDVARMADVFDADGVILDGMAPHVWRGASAVHDWYRDVMAESGHVGASDYAVVVGEPRHNDISDDRAYVVLPASMPFALDGKHVTQTKGERRP